MDGTKMSKSKGNLIAPEHYFDTVGADALRLFHLFVGPPFDDMDWSDQTEQVIEGCGRFLDRLWRTCTAEHAAAHGAADGRRPGRAPGRAPHHRRRDPGPGALVVQHGGGALHGAAQPGPALRAQRRGGPSENGSVATRAHADVWNEALDTLLLLLAAMTPHVTAELWEHRHPGEPSVHLQRWPTFDPELVRQETVTMVVQVNGKVRDRIEVDAGISEGDAEAAALASAKVIEALGGAAPKRVVARPPRLVNVVA